MSETGFVVILFLVAFSITNGDSISTSTGPIKGITVKTPLGKSVRSYLGIPFAEPPVGNLRFRPPLPVKTWKNVFEASTKSKSCIQFVNRQDIKSGFDWWLAAVEETSEDCLTLNIWVPDPTPKNAAVMVWIHGGGFTAGTSATDVFDGQLLASEGEVIVVSLNYRVGALGFLYLDAVEAPGNVGLMDQALGLKWIQDNIGKFGGDPAKVTIFGQSAGGASVSYHLSIPTSRGLFKRVIAQSGTINVKWGGYDTYTATKVGENFAHLTSCSDNAKERKDMVDCLRKMEVERLVEESNKIPILQPMPFKPVFDGVYLPNKPLETLENNVDVMLGATTEDGLFFALFDGKILEPREDSYISDVFFVEYLKNALQIKDSGAKFVKLFYTDWEDPEDLANIRKQFGHFLTDMFLLCDINLVSDLLSSNGNRVFRYQFGHHPSVPATPSWMGSGHCDEISFLFGWPLLEEKGFTKQEAKLSRYIINLWTNFSKFGHPNGLSFKEDSSWPLYKNKTRQHVFIDDRLSLNVGSATDLRIQECSLYDKILPHYLETLDSAEKCTV